MKKVIIAAILSIAIAPASYSQDFFDPESSGHLFGLGIRLGANVSNLSNNYESSFSSVTWSNIQRKAGFTVGAVIDINFAKSFALQPGFYYQSRNSEYYYEVDNGNILYRDGHRHSSYFQIPILASFRMGLSALMQLQVDFGPYFSFGMGSGSDKCTMINTAVIGDNEQENLKRDYFGEYINKYDWGFKMGVGFLVIRHYYLGVHYEAGCRNVLRPIIDGVDIKGHNKAWDFTVGYNF